MRKPNSRMIMANIVGMMPTNTIRTYLYRTMFGYRIFRSYIGWKTIIVADEAELDECYISGNNRFIGPMKMTIGKGARIREGNTFCCGWWAQEDKFKSANYGRYLRIGVNTLIASEHYIDVVGAFTIGENSCIAGCGSQFWTHGAGVSERNITIGNNCYIGSAVRFSPGSSVGNNNTVGMGSVVTKKFNVEQAFIAGQPAKVVKENYMTRTQQAFY